MKKFLNTASKLIFSRTLVIVLMIVAQIAILALGGAYLTRMFPEFLVIFDVLGAIFLVIIINRDEPAEFKLTWAVIIAVLPVFGVLMYAFTMNNYGMVRLKKKVEREIKSTRGILSTSDGTKEALLKQDKVLQRFAYFMEQDQGFPIYHNTKLSYYPEGVEAINALIEELKKAKEYIFIEYFIIAEGKVWDSVLEILKEKVKEGVEVKVMYDGLCSIFKLPYRYPQKLAEYGIDAKMFAPIIPFLSTTQNNRDHRKIVVIDGNVAFTGGVNLADEYANYISLYGYWKDVAIKIEGHAVMSMTRMFLQNWNLYGKEDLNYDKYLLDKLSRSKFEHDGFVIPYADSPTDDDELGKNVYSAVFSHATDYVHIMTPYFIVDREFLSVMKYAAQRGIEVKIILPHIPDKKVAFWVARSYYKILLQAGIKVYEYRPGFIHAKVAIADDKVATVGSVNLDYRSFYHHFENGIYVYGNKVVDAIERDFQNTLADCIEVDKAHYEHINVFTRIIGRIVRFFAPLM